MAQAVPRDTVFDWINDLFKGCTGLEFDGESYPYGQYRWIWRNQFWHLTYIDPPPWFVLRVYLWHRKHQRGGGVS